MKNLLILLLTIFALQGTAQRFILKDGETFTYKSYPRKDFAPLVGLDDNLQWYVEVRGESPVYDSRVYSRVSTLQFTETASDYGNHILIANLVYDTVRLADEVIFANIRQAANDYLETLCPKTEQDNLRTEGLLLLEKSILGTATAADEARKTYLKQIQIWFVAVRSQAESMINDYPEVPDFNFQSKPIEP